MSRYAYIRGSNQAWSHPAHKRRFPRFARRNGITFSDYVTDMKFGEVNILSPAADITFWRREAIKNGRRLVFDANDPFLLSDESSIKEKFRGSFKFLSGQQKYFEQSYRDSYKRQCIACVVECERSDVKPSTEYWFLNDVIKQYVES